LSVLIEHDLFGKPVSTFPDHALVDEDCSSLIAAIVELSEILEKRAPKQREDRH
jgi:hypothetical protein